MKEGRGKNMLKGARILFFAQSPLHQSSVVAFWCDNHLGFA
jgi:hypothetical protein